MANYTPRDLDPGDWARIEWYVRDVIAATMKPGHKDPMTHVWTVARYVHWAHILNGRPLEHQHLGQKRLVVAFTERALAGRRGPYVTTERSRLLAVVRVLNRAERPLPTKQRPKVANPPYEQSQIDRFAHTARAVNTPYARRSIRFIVALSTGAGLNPSDYIRLRNRNIEVTDDGVILDVPECGHAARTSLRPRRVPVVAAWEAEVRELMAEPDLDPDAFVIWPKTIATRNDLQALTGGMKRVLPNAEQRPVISRLRTTWLVGHLQAGVPVHVVTEAAGYSTVESLARYMQYVDLPDTETQMRLMRGTTR